MNRSLSVWLSASRPQTLPAAVIPVMAGASLALAKGALQWNVTLVILICALLIQIGTNFANDYYDFIKGSDTEERIGFTRATSAGLISPAAMLKAAWISMGLAFIAGLWLIWIGGWVILLIGLLSILFGFLYTGGPYPLGYNGLGDIFVFLFFGIIAVTGTYYLNTLEWSLLSLSVSLPVGALSVNILVVNNLRDVEQDRKSGKRTLGVLLGDKALKVEYLMMQGVAFITPVLLLLFSQAGFSILLPLLLIPLALKLHKSVWNHTDKRLLNGTLEETARFMVFYGILFASGILFSGL
ncbi:MAG: 1,4-dihydroxy-2-naphthoate polyprenyltransferase [Balneolaceae bacterium]|nr:MAG: 1,4-dihydroxy-2-naphthoate polyprenyltransferase [Balneolaceae bacterium]